MFLSSSMFQRFLTFLGDDHILCCTCTKSHLNQTYIMLTVDALQCPMCLPVEKDVLQCLSVFQQQATQHENICHILQYHMRPSVRQPQMSFSSCFLDYPAGLTSRLCFTLCVSCHIYRAVTVAKFDKPKLLKILLYFYL